MHYANRSQLWDKKPPKSWTQVSCYNWGGKVSKGWSYRNENIDKSNNDNNPKSDDNKADITVKWIQYLQTISDKVSYHVWDSWWIFRVIWQYPWYYNISAQVLYVL